MHTNIRIIAIFTCCIALVGCAMQGPLPEDHFYHLQSDAPTNPLNTPTLDGILVIQRFRADGLRTGRALLRAGPDGSAELRKYHYHYWVDSPTRMIPAHLVRYLRAANIALVVSESESGLAPDYTLSGRIRHFESVRDQTGQGIKIFLEILVKDERSDKVLLLRDYSRNVHLGAAEVADSAAAFSKALEEIYANIIADLAES